MQRLKETRDNNVRVTRSRAKALGDSIAPSQAAIKQESKFGHRVNNKRMASDCSVTVTANKNKRRVVLKDVSNTLNICTEGNVKGCKRGQKDTKKKAEGGADIAMEVLVDVDFEKSKLAEDMSKIRVVESLDDAAPNSKDREVTEQSKKLHLPKNTNASKLTQGSLDCAEEDSSYVIVDIDSGVQDLQCCSLYAASIYESNHVAELDHRPSTSYMVQVQRDIDPNMRGILIDWLVEVSEEYNLASDTLYLTVNLIDRFMSHNYIEKQRLQLLGVACMLIASKYEEISAPRLEEFCFITDNTYTRLEVISMEIQILNSLHFRLSVPTTRTFLRRFIQAAQASDKVQVPNMEMEFLANYFAELTLVDYTFLRFLPSLIAASAVFLARWTLDQSNHPWNPTLQHYTRYETSSLKNIVVAMEDLQLNINGSNLIAIRTKYNQEKFKRVATLTSSASVTTLFSR